MLDAAFLSPNLSNPCQIGLDPVTTYPFHPLADLNNAAERIRCAGKLLRICALQIPPGLDCPRNFPPFVQPAPDFARLLI
jgi:hypothetical protein